MTHIEIDFTKPLPSTQYNLGDYVLYRAPDRYWTGQDDHTFPCQVGLPSLFARTVELTDLRDGREFTADVRYVRPLPPEDCMRDIDTAPLAADHPELHPAAVAWLEQNTLAA